MISEWLKVMLDEIARKKAESEQARIEAERRGDDQARGDGPAGGDGPSSGDEQRRREEGRAPNTDAARRAR
jgi:hypothetical protein